MWYEDASSYPVVYLVSCVGCRIGTVAEFRAIFWRRRNKLVEQSKIAGAHRISHLLQKQALEISRILVPDTLWGYAGLLHSIALCNDWMVAHRLVAYQNQEKQLNQNHVYQVLEVKFPSQRLYWCG